MSGGARPNSGRKPKISAGKHKSKAEQMSRTETFEKLKTTNKLSCPKYLSQAAKKEWKRTMKLYKLMEADILNDLDVAALVMYCEAWAIYRTNQDELNLLNEKLNQIDATDDKTINKLKSSISGCIKVMNEQTAIVTKLSEQLCLSPVGRARMGINPAKKQPGQKLLDLLNS